MKTCTISRLLFLMMAYTICACSDSRDEMVVVLEGKISNLPDGTMYLTNELAITIDSTLTKDGEFVFKMARAKFKNPTYAQLKHVAQKDSMVRLFTFPIATKLGGSPTNTSLIMLESPSSKLIGTLQDTDYAKKNKSSTVKGKPIFGKQSTALYSDTLDLSKGISILDMKKQIEKFPLSYHLLFKLKAISHKLTPPQLTGLIGKFDKEIRDGEQARTLIKNASDTTLKFNRASRFTNRAGEKVKILEADRLNMIVLWASWCGPCRREIPQLKGLHKNFLKKMQIVSVSLDTDREKWLHAMDVEQMPWLQVTLSEKQMELSKQIFEFDGSIPLILFYDKKGKLLKKVTGYNFENMEELNQFITENTL